MLVAIEQILADNSDHQVGAFTGALENHAERIFQSEVILPASIRSVCRTSLPCTI